MGAIGLNPIRLDAIGLDPIRFNAIKLGVPGASSATDRPYISPDVLSALAGVWIADGKSNTDPDRNIIKNKLPGRGGDFEIFNAAYEGMSGCNGYPVVFGANKTWEHLSGTANYTSDTTSTTIHITHVRLANRGLLYSYVKENGVLTNIKEIPAFRVTVKGLEGNSKLVYKYLATKDATKETSLHLSNGTHKLPKSFVPTDALLDLTTNSWIGMFISPISEEVTEFDCDITIEVLPEYEGSFVTDGVNDMIVSQNPVSEMLGGSNELTIVSMIHQITGNENYTNGYTNCIRHSGGFIRNVVAGKDGKGLNKTGIYGYTSTQLDSSNMGLGNVINNILGDKEDYAFERSSTYILDDAKYSVQNFINGEGNVSNEGSQVAWYWTFIAKRVLTTDEINQVIAYYNLDKYVKPDIYYDVKKQGLTNDNHAQFGDKLIDYSGNSRDLQLFNIGWKPGSGIGKYVTNFGIWSKDAESNISYNSYSFTVNGSLKRTWLMWYVTELPSFKIKVSGINSNGYVDYGYYDNGSLKNFRLDKDGIHTLPPSGASSNGHGFKVNDTSLDWTGLVIEQIPDFAGALCFDEVDDYGQFVGDLGLKDYTVAVDRAYPSIIKDAVPVVSGLINNSATPFIFEYVYNNVRPYSFGKYTDLSIALELDRKISYQSTYNYNGVSISKGEQIDTGKGITIGRYGDDRQYANIVLWSFLLFPYTLSEFLLERQLKKHKLGTLYPGMVEFRPIISGRTDLIKEIKWYSDSWSKRIYVGDYIPKGVDVTANILLNDNTSELVKATYGNNYTEVRKQANWSETNNEWDLIIHNIGKSPQKIGITIDEYIRFEDIVQPYPVKFRFTDVDSGQVYDWGSKIKVGSTIKILSNVDIGNYLSDIYTITGYKYNGNIYSYNELNKLTFEVTNSPLEFASRKTYKLGGYEPKVILYPERLKLSNDTYKRLGYIPDLTGNGNHGKINNSAYGGMSGVNGYPYDYKSGFMAYSNSKLIDSETFNIIAISASVNIIKSSPTYKGKIKVTGLSGYLKLRIYPKNDSTNAVEIFEDGIYDINIDNETDNIYFHAVKTNVGSNDVNIIIQQVGEYEGAFCLDGVDDYISIPTLSKGGKQVLMKVNWQKQDTMLYNQNPGQDNFAIFTNDYNNNNLVVAYASRNNGNTYIDGVVNNNILATQLKGITHNIVATNNNIDATITPIIGSNKNHDNFFAQMALYSFMLFDEISTDEEIKDLNDIVGIVSKVELPPYYWDTYGKTNTDADRDEIVNLASDEVSIQYPTDFTDTSVWEDMGAVTSSTILTLTTWAMGGDTGIGNTIKAKVATPAMKVKFITDGNGYLDYMYSGYNTLELPRDAGEYEVELPASTIVDGWGARFSGSGNGSFIIELLGNEVRSGTLKVINSAYDEDSGYKNNGIALDGVDDSLVNTDIPAFTDFTVIAKRIFLGDQPNNVVFLFKGDKVYGQGVGNALLMEYRYDNGTYANYIFSNANSITLNEGDISYVTPTDYNGQQMNYVVNTDNKGLVIGRSNAVYWKGVFYKLMLYPKTIDILSINMLKNLFERDEIIDLNNPIFKK